MSQVLNPTVSASLLLNFGVARELGLTDPRPMAVYFRRDLVALPPVWYLRQIVLPAYHQQQKENARRNTEAAQ